MAELAYDRGPVRVAIGATSTVRLPSRIFRVRLTGMLFEDDKTFLLPQAMRGIRGLVELYTSHGQLQVLVTGHTDRLGDDTYNVGLSRERADAIAHYLKDEADEWLAWYRGKSHSRPWGVREDQMMLATVFDDASQPFYGGPIDGMPGPDTADAVARFQQQQSARGTALAVDGQLGPQTRRALVSAYMQLDGTTLPAAAQLTQHGCGEHHNEVPTADGVAEPRNRRVEVFLFDAPAIDPSPRDPCPAPDGCSEYPVWRDKTLQTIDFDHDLGRLVIRIVDDATGLPLDRAAVHLSREGFASHDGTTDGDGVVTFEDLISGSYTVTAARDGFVTTDAPATVTSGGAAANPGADRQATPTPAARNDLVGQVGDSPAPSPAPSPSGGNSGPAQTVRLSPVTFKLTLHFQSARPPQPAALLAGATVTTDGGSASSPSGSDGQLVVTLGQGKHTLQLDAKDHFSTTQTLDLQSDQELTVQLNRKAVVGTRLRSCAWVNGTQDKLPMFKSTLASGHCDTVIWQLFFVNGKGPDGYSRRGPRGINPFDWDRKLFKDEVDRIHSIGALALCEWVRAEEKASFSVVNDLLLGNPKSAVSRDAFKAAILAELDAYCKVGVFWDGVSFDLENVGLSPKHPDAVKLRDAMTSFMDDLGQSLHQSGRILSLTVGAKSFDSLTDPKQAGVNDATGEGAMQFVYDWKGLAAAAVDLLPCMCYSAVTSPVDGKTRNINFTDKIFQQTLVHAGKTCGFDKFLLGVAPDDGRHVALAQQAKGSGCGVSVFTANGGNTWQQIDSALNPSGPLSCFSEQPKGTPTVVLDSLNQRNPPQPPVCPH